MIKKYSEFISEEVGWKDALIGSTLALSTLNPTKAQNPQNIQIDQLEIKKNVLSTIKGPIGIQDISNADLDLVHGILGSKRLDDDFENRVSNELQRLNKLGYKTDVSNVNIKTYIKGNKIVTESYCDIIKSIDGNSYTIFTTRGSIGDNYEKRHDGQINGLENRLEDYYGGKSKKVNTEVISFLLNGKKVSYKQSFFVSSEIKTYEIVGTDLSDLRENLKLKSKDISIDSKSIKIDIKNMKISFKSGDEKIKVLSLVFDNKNQIDSRLDTIKEKNPSSEIIDSGKHGSLDWCILIIR